MFYIQFFMRNPFLMKKMMVGGQKCQNRVKNQMLCTFLHILCRFLHYSWVVQGCPSSGPCKKGIWHVLWHFWVQKRPKTAKNGLKWPKRPKLAKKWPKTVKNAIFFLHFFWPIFFLLCRYFICCSLNQLEMAQNGQKWPKTVKNGIFDRFWGRKKSTPPG